MTVAALPAGEPAKYAIFFSDWTKAAVALDADTGKQLWKTTIDDQPGEQMTGSLTCWDGKIFVPISSGNEWFAQAPNWECCKFRGALVAMNATTGEQLWSTPTSIKPTCRWKNFWCHGALSQATSIMPGVVFAGSYDGRSRAYDVATGRVIRDTDTGTDPVTTVAGTKTYGGVMDGAGPTIAGGMVYVHSG